MSEGVLQMRHLPQKGFKNIKEVLAFSSWWIFVLGNSQHFLLEGKENFDGPFSECLLLESSI